MFGSRPDEGWFVKLLAREMLFGHGQSMETDDPSPGGFVDRREVIAPVDEHCESSRRWQSDAEDIDTWDYYERIERTALETSEIRQRALDALVYNKKRNAYLEPYGSYEECRKRLNNIRFEWERA